MTILLHICQWAWCHFVIKYIKCYTSNIQNDIFLTISWICNWLQWTEVPTAGQLWHCVIIAAFFSSLHIDEENGILWACDKGCMFVLCYDMLVINVPRTCRHTFNSFPAFDSDCLSFLNCRNISYHLLEHQFKLHSQLLLWLTLEVCNIVLERYFSNVVCILLLVCSLNKKSKFEKEYKF